MCILPHSTSRFALATFQVLSSRMWLITALLDSAAFHNPHSSLAFSSGFLTFIPVLIISKTFNGSVYSSLPWSLKKQASFLSARYPSSFRWENTFPSSYYLKSASVPWTVPFLFCELSAILNRASHLILLVCLSLLNFVLLEEKGSVLFISVIPAT